MENLQRQRITQVIGPRESVGVWAADLWRYRGTLFALCARDIRGKYKQSVLGLAWALIQPLALVGVYSFVFAGVAKVQTPVPYPVFVLSALLPFNLFQQIVSLGTPAFVQSQSITTKVYFPRLYTVIAGSASALMNATVTFSVLVFALLYYRTTPLPRLWLALPCLAGIFLLAIGLASLLGAVNARFRDVQHALPLMMTMLLFVSPVLYPLPSVPNKLRPFALANPVTGLVDGFRTALTGGEPFSWALIGAALAMSLVIFVAGVLVFERTQAQLIDVL
jgi:lipopolysaccharide transport system permease protein